MSIKESIEQTWKDEDEFIKRNQVKIGYYNNPENGCPNCGRFRIMKGSDGKNRCEKCYWCIDDNKFDGEFAKYMS